MTTDNMAREQRGGEAAPVTKRGRGGRGAQRHQPPRAGRLQPGATAGQVDGEGQDEEAAAEMDLEPARPLLQELPVVMQGVECDLPEGALHVPPTLCHCCSALQLRGALLKLPQFPASPLPAAAVLLEPRRAEPLSAEALGVLARQDAAAHDQYLRLLRFDDRLAELASQRGLLVRFHVRAIRTHQAQVGGQCECRGGQEAHASPVLLPCGALKAPSRSPCPPLPTPVPHSRQRWW